MKSSPAASLLRSVTLVASLLCLVGRAVAGGGVLSGGTVIYSPQSEGVAAVVPAVDSYVLNVSPPLAYTAFPVTVQLRVVPQTVPLGTILTAASYIQLSTNTLTFTSASQSLPVTVTMSFPLSAVSPDLPEPHYTYSIYTDGWAAPFVDGGAVISAGLAIGAIINPATPNPPAVNIITPNDGDVYTVAPNAFPAQIAFSYTAGTDSVSPLITTVAASLESSASTTPVSITTNGLGTANIVGNGTLTIPGPGTYTVTIDVANSVGPASDQNTFTVLTGTVPPTVSIQTPAPGTSYTYRAGSPALVVPLTFTGHSNYAVRTLTATLDGDDVSNLYTPAGLGSVDATGSIGVPYTTAGNHVLVVTTTDDYGTASATTTYSVAVVAPTPTLTITTPAESQVFTIPYPGTALNVPFAFTTTSNNGFVVDSVSATLNGTAVSVSTAGLGTASATSAGTFLNVVPGSYTFTANGSSAGIPVTQTVRFTVQATNPPPTVVINTPAPNATFTRLSTDSALSIPMSFTGTSNATGGVITGVTATLDGSPLAFTPTLGTKVVVNNATMTVLAAGTHTIKVTATDFVGTATATQTFTVTVIQGYTISGSIFFDVDTDGIYDTSEFGLSNVTVTLRSKSGQTLATTTAAADGTYSFPKLAAGTYIVTATTPAGLAATNGVTRTGVVANANVTGVNIGFMIDFCALQNKSATGFTIGYWKNNVDKAIKGAKSGVQVPAATLKTYTSAIGSLALSPYDNVTLKEASAIMGSTSSAPADLLSKQLIASEYNYENKAYINGNATVTFLFTWWGEYVLKNSSNYSSTYILWAKDWFDAYNNSHGGAISGPSLTGTSCTGGAGSTNSCGGAYSQSCSDSSYSGSWSCSNSWSSGAGW